MARILVTGGAGFIGSHLVDALVAKRHRVVVIDDLSSGKRTNVHPNADLRRLDIRSPKLSRFIRSVRPVVVFHLAAQKSVKRSVEDPIEDANVNIIGSLRLLEASWQNGVRKVIFSSTGGAMYGDVAGVPPLETVREHPASPYGIAKLATDRYLAFYHLTHRLPYVSLRLANVYGPRQDPKGEAGVVAIFLDALLASKTPRINGDGRQTRDYVYVDDVVRALMLSMRSRAQGPYHIGTGRETTVNELYSEIARIGGFPQRATHGPALPGEQRRSVLNCSRAKHELGWQPRVALRTGLQKTISWSTLHQPA